MKKILITDDDFITREIIAGIVDSMGCASIQSSNGLIALDVLYDNPDISLLVVDMMMPRMDGRTLIQILRREEKFVNLPIILISGIISIHEVNDLLTVGASRFMPKPINGKTLKEYIHRLIG